MKKLLLIAVVAALSSMGYSQGRMMMMGRGGGGIQLAMRDDVAKELGLTPDQKTKLQDAQDKMREERRAAREAAGGGSGPGGGGAGGGMPDQATMAKMFAEGAAKEKTVLAGILTDDQMKRLHELRIQRQGNSAILDPEVQAALKLTDVQKKSVSDLQQKQMDAGQAIMEKVRNQEMDFQAARPIFEKNMKIMNDELGKILTADQAKQLADMGGKPFTFDASLDQQGPGGR